MRIKSRDSSSTKEIKNSYFILQKLLPCIFYSYFIFRLFSLFMKSNFHKKSIIIYVGKTKVQYNTIQYIMSINFK
jgi:hypothetical protein